MKIKSFNLGNSYILGSAKREWAWKKFNLNSDKISKYLIKEFHA